jgi:hypothetical protein
MGYASQQLASAARAYRGGYASQWLADYHGSQAAGGGGGGGSNLARTTSGIVFSDTFNRADGSPGGNWTADQGTWAISSNVLQNTSAANFDRIRNTGVSLADGVYEARVRAPASGRYAGLRILAPDANDDYHLWLHDGSDNSLGYAAASDSRISSNLITEDGNFHVLKLIYITSRKFVVYYDHVAVLGSVAAPFTSGAGPTATAGVGFMAYNGQSDFDWVLVSSDHLISVGGLAAGQGFQLLDPSDVAIGSSGAESGGTATLDISGLVDGLTTGYIQTYDDQGTWAVPTPGGRYPASSTASDICGGDVYTLSP